MRVGERASIETGNATANEPGMRFEIDRGTVVTKPASSLAHHFIVAAIVRLLDAFVIEHDLGYVFPDGLAYLLQQEPDIVRIPDASFISNERSRRDTDMEGSWVGAPDLAVEVVAPDDNAIEFHNRVQQYLESGARAVWVVWPTTSSISVLTPDKCGHEHQHNAMLDSGEFLPGFSVPVARIFERPPARRRMSGTAKE